MPDQLDSLLTGMKGQDPLDGMLVSMKKTQPSIKLGDVLDTLKTTMLHSGPTAIASANPGRSPVTADDAINFLRPLVAGGAAGLATAAAAPTGPLAPAAGVGAYALTDIAMQHALSKPAEGFLSSAIGATPGSVKSQLANSGESGLLNELFSSLGPKVSRAIVNAGKEMANPGAVVGDIYKLNPTFSQYYENMFGKRATKSKWLEDIFATSLKAKQIEDAGETGFANAGGKGFNPQAAADSTQANLKSASMQMRAESNRLGNKAVAISETNPHIVMRAIPGSTNLAPDIVTGPIDISGTVDAAQKYIADQANSVLPGMSLSQKQSELLKLSRQIIEKASATDPTTGATHLNPISFRDAWDLKQLADEFSSPPKMATPGTPDIVQPSSTRGYYKDISQSLNDDIEKSIPTWQNNSGEALQSWKQAKAVVNQRLTLLKTPGDSLSSVIDSAQSVLPDLDKIIADPKQLQRALTAGEVKFPSGGMVKTSTRNDLGAYSWQKILNDSMGSETGDPTKSVFNAKKALDSWNDPAFQDSKKLLFSASVRQHYDQLLKELAITQVKQGSFGAYTKLWVARGAVTLAPALALGYVKGLEGSGAAIVGVGIGATAMARLMVNPTTARAMAAAASGQALNMSQDAFARAVGRAAAGSTLNLIQNDGKTISGSVGGDGRFVPSGS